MPPAQRFGQTRRLGGNNRASAGKRLSRGQLFAPAFYYVDHPCLFQIIEQRYKALAVQKALFVHPDQLEVLEVAALEPSAHRSGHDLVYRLPVEPQQFPNR